MLSYDKDLKDISLFFFFFFPTSLSHVLKLIASGNEDALVSAVKSVSHFLRQVDIY